MSDFLSLHTALSGVLAARAGIDTTAHNVANSASEGYTRQRVRQLSRTEAYHAAYGSIGTGAEVAGVTRFRDAFLDLRVRSGLATLGGLSTRATLFDQVEQALAEPDQGVSAAMSATWNALEDLALSPTDPASRRNVLATLDALASRIRTVSRDWAQVGSDVRVDLARSIDEVNGLLHEVASLNDAIRRSPGVAVTPNDLADRRDLALDRLAELVGASITEFDDGTVRVSVGGVALLQGSTVRELALDPSDLSIDHPSGVEVAVGGAVGERQRFLLQELPGLEASLDAFVEDLVTALNDRHAAGWFSPTDPGEPLLAYTPGAAAATVALVMTDPERLAAASDPGPPFPVHDGGNAQWMASLRTDPVAAGGTRSLDESWRELVTRIGVDTAAARDAAEVQESLHASAQQARMGTHGVSTDEEMVLLVQYQHAYQASARVMTAVDELLDLLVNRLGTVGR